MKKYYIGIDVGGTNVRIGHGAPSEELCGFERIPRGQILQGQDFGESLGAYISQYSKQAGIEGCVEAVAIGLPSTLNKDRSMVLQPPNIPGMDGIPLKEELENLLSIPVFLEKDTNMLFYHDSQGKDYDGMALGIYIGTGIGNALFINGCPYIGADGVAGELGHIPFRYNKETCGCGNTGCAESVASGQYLVRLRQEHFSDTSLEELFVKYSEEMVLCQFVDDVALVAATEINILNPAFVVLGGGVLDMRGFPKDRLVKRIHSYCRRPYPEQNLKLYFAEAGQYSGVKGAITYAWKQR